MPIFPFFYKKTQLLNNTEENIKALLEKITHLKLAKSHLQKLDTRLLEAYQELANLESKMDKELSDVEKLQDLTIHQLFSKILGGQEQRLEIERQEYLEAVLNYKDAKKSIDLMKFEKEVLEEKTIQLPMLTKELNVLLEKRESEILNYGGSAQNQLKVFNSQIDDNFQLKREIYEAKIIGTKVRVLSESIIKNLQEAHDKERFIDEHGNMLKRRTVGKSNVQQAQETFYRLKNETLKFEDELEDIYSHREIKFRDSLQGFHQLSKIYYGNLINDWVVSQRIMDALSFVKTFHNRVQRTLLSLDREEKMANEKTIYLQERKKEIIKGSL